MDISFFVQARRSRRTLGKPSRARSDAEFCSKLDGLLQEADESELWLELLRDDCGIRSDSLDELHRETGEFIAIFTAMVSRTKRRS